MRLFAFLTLTLFLSFQTLTAEEPLHFLSSLPFKQGEQITYAISLVGVYIGDQTFYQDGWTNWNGTPVLKGRTSLKTNPSISSMYKIDDWDETYFNPDNFLPVYNQGWANEGNWHNFTRFRFYQDGQRVEIEHKVYNYRTDVQFFKGTLRNYFSLIQCLRSLDFDYYIAGHKTIEMNYLFKTFIKKVVFTPSMTKVFYEGKNVDAVSFKDAGGIGISLKIIKNESRLPYEIIVNDFEIAGWKTVTMTAAVKDFHAGSESIILKETNQ